MSNIQFTLRSGRRIGITAMGEPAAARVVVFCHPAPGSSEFDPDPIVSAAHGAHILAIDRPGYGSSDPLPEGEWPTVTGAADDIAEYLRSSENTAHALGAHELDTVGVVGWSAGGRVALALAARHPDLVERVALVGTPAPNDEVEWIPREFAEMSATLATLPAAEAIDRLTEAYAAQRGVRPDADDTETPVSLGELGLADVDAPVLARPGAQDRLEKMLHDAYRQGTIGVVTDILSYTARPWGFDLSTVAAATLLVYGEADLVAPLAHGAWYERNMADAVLHPVPDAGHLLIVPEWGRVLEHVAGVRGR